MLFAHLECDTPCRAQTCGLVWGPGPGLGVEAGVGDHGSGTRARAGTRAGYWGQGMAGSSSWSCQSGGFVLGTPGLPASPHPGSGSDSHS